MTEIKKATIEEIITEKNIKVVCVSCIQYTQEEFEMELKRAKMYKEKIDSYDYLYEIMLRGL